MKQVAIAFDQFLNACLGGMADETLSARAHRMRVKGHKHWSWTANAIDKLFFWQFDHCFRAWEAEKQRRQLPDAYRFTLSEY